MGDEQIDPMIINAISYLRDITLELEGRLIPRYNLDTTWCRQGSQGHIFKGYDKANNGRIVAIKIGGYRDEKLYKHFEKEHRLLSKIDHPNIIRIYAYHKAAERPVLAMEYVPLNLEAIIGRRQNFDLEDVIKYLDPVASAVDCIHKCKDEEENYWVHRDIKPANVVICEDGTIKLSDFGCAGFSGRASSRKGTLQYRATEGFEQGGGYFCAESDIYSMAVLACDVLVKQNPFQDISENDMLEFKKNSDNIKNGLKKLGIPDNLAKILMRGMHPDRRQRFHYGREFVESLKDLKVSIDREQARIAALNRVYKLSDRIITVLSRKPTGLYRTMGLSDIDDIYETHSNLEDIAESYGFTEDGRYKEAIRLFEEKKLFDRGLLDRELDKVRSKSFNFEKLEEVLYNVGAIAHCWPGLADERFSKKQIGDGTYQGYLEKNPERIGDGTYSRHFEAGFPKPKKK